jgi:hypothetical protein
VYFPTQIQVSGGTTMQRPENQTTTGKRPYQVPKLELHGVWQIATGVTLSIGTNLIPSDFELIPSELEVKL